MSNTINEDVVSTYTMHSVEGEDRFKIGQTLSAGVNRNPPPAPTAVVVIIDSRALEREILSQAIISSSQFRAETFAEIAQWELSSCYGDTALILLVLGAASYNEWSLETAVTELVSAHFDIPFVVLGENEDPHHIAEILAQGARGYIPTSVSLGVAIGALCLVMAGGTFIPASVLQHRGRELWDTHRSAYGMFGLSERQATIAETVAHGKPNKIIAYELQLCESTVKVHIRAIMKKLQARNRTEIAFKMHAAKGAAQTGREMRLVGGHAA